jgi:hypothetical protein
MTVELLLSRNPKKFFTMAAIVARTKMSPAPCFQKIQWLLEREFIEEFDYFLTGKERRSRLLYRWRAYD